MMLDENRARSIDEILCDPELAEEFDGIARRFAPGFDSLSYRWAALKLRKQAKFARAARLLTPRHLGKAVAIEDLEGVKTPESAGVYLVGLRRNRTIRSLYVGECVNLRTRLARQFSQSLPKVWREQARRRKLEGDLCVQYVTTSRDAGMLAYQSHYVTKHEPPLNLRDLRAGA
jgi:site-specific DNA-methyltransferase (adenine-specific)